MSLILIIVFFITVALLLGSLAPSILSNGSQDCTELPGHINTITYASASQTTPKAGTLTITAKEPIESDYYVVINPAKNQALAIIIGDRAGTTLYTINTPKDSTKVNTLISWIASFTPAVPFELSSTNPAKKLNQIPSPTEFHVTGGGGTTSITGWAETCNKLTENTESSLSFMLLIPLIVAVAAVFIAIRYF